MFRSLSMLTCLLAFLIVSTPRAAVAGSMRQDYVRQEVAKYGPLDCGITYALFTIRTIKVIEDRIQKQGREGLFQTPNNEPYPFRRISLDDLITIRDLITIEDTTRRDWWDYQIREAAQAAYIRLGE